ncbi:T9SS type A sorting domain-containing protein [Flavilitoribacter nigricans]|uniref:Secretion system C-terminal sorting domain-containing protein n=1 Tax=Flavilitoribacter nigricans (strain ATCC 23147 / DSM 23189 / NBRC 102662 / NCIMB 1420 / SS-2) TaxID=1122177 RepID=A0A2D0NJA4_FLAN2|nr:T9SS type A sorting domain-containing protein [Flavilitoribacter nigricans]PHN08279.1 hypothetical protein CRP01_02860 [Flavilitoribacter nigricans DSM 23189 = NBRC 102662]
MKICTLIFRLFPLFLLLTVSSRSVTAQRLVEEGKQWNMSASSGFSPNVWSYSLRLSGDTTVAGNTFLKVWRSDDSLQQSRYFTGRLLREDEQQRVWMKQGEEAETLLYDFGLQPGDSITFAGLCTAYLMETDTVVLNNGDRRRRMHFKYKQAVGIPEQFWIEGIGSQFGLLEHWASSCYTDVGDWLLCHFEEGSLVYPDNPTSCFLVSAPEPSLSANLRVYPNPTTGPLTIDREINKLKAVTLLDLQGRVIRNWNPKNRDHKLDISELPSGMYFLQLNIGNSLRPTLKIVKQN